LIHNPILKVLSTFQNCNGQFLLMGGQACILYGAAEFSRDTDLAILATEENLEALQSALQSLDAEPVFLPPLELSYLQRGHACHFRCHHPDCAGLRIDLMARMRGCDEFPQLWERRQVFDLPSLGAVPVLSLPDLVQTKKTQRDKDWPMVRRLVEVDYWVHHKAPPPGAVRWWLAESRTPALMLALASAYPDLLASVPERPWLAEAVSAGRAALETALAEEEQRIREEDRAYWQVLRQELEAMRHGRAPGTQDPQSGKRTRSFNTCAI